MKKTELIIVCLFSTTQSLMAQSDDGATKMVAMGLAAVVFYGILAIVRGFKAKNSNKDEE